MADAATIKDLFVSVGYKLDESSQQRAQSGIAATSTAVQKFDGVLQQVQKTLAEFSRGFTSIVESNRKVTDAIEGQRKAVLEWGRTFANSMVNVDQSIRQVNKGVMDLGKSMTEMQDKSKTAQEKLSSGWKDVAKVGLAAGAGWLAAMRSQMNQLEDLRQQAMRTGASARDLAALSTESRKAVDSIESLMRAQPGMRPQFTSRISQYLGQIQNDMPKASKAVQEHFASLEALADMTPHLAAQFGQMWYGWSEQETQNRINNRNRDRQNFEAYLSSLDAAGMTQEKYKQATERAAEAQQKYQQTLDKFKIVFTTAFADAAPALISILELVGKVADVLLWITNNVPGASLVITFASFLPVAAGVLKVLGQLKGGFGALQAIGSLLGGAGGLVGAFTAIKGVVLAVVPVIGTVVTALAPMLAAAAAILAVVKAAQYLRGQMKMPEAGSTTDPNAPQNQSGWRKWVFGDPFGLGSYGGGDDSEGGEGELPQGGGSARRPPNYQRGGIVNANLHQGEMVLPQNISQGMQALIANQPAMQAAQSMAARVNAQLSAWLSGTAGGPKVVIENIQEFWQEFLNAQANAKAREQAKLTGAQEAPGADTGAPGAPGGAAGATAGGTAGAGGAAAAGAAAAVEGGGLSLDGGAPVGAAVGDWRTAPRGVGPTGMMETTGAEPGAGTAPGGGFVPRTVGGRLGAAMGQAATAIGRAAGGGAPEIGEGAVATARGAVGRGAGFAERAGDLMTRMQSELGLTREQAAGFVGNLAHETGDFRSMQEKTSMRGGLGYAQWTGVRRDKFEQFLKARGASATDHDANVDFLIQELKTDESEALKRLRGAGSVAEASDAAHRGYFRSADVTRPGYHAGVGRVIRPGESSPKRLAAAQAAMGLGGDGDQVVVSPGAAFGTGAPVPQMGERGRGAVTGESADPRGLVQQMQAGTRNQKINAELLKQLSGAAEETGVQVRVTSGGQDVKGKGSRRTGSTRHDAGAAADVQLIDPKTGRKLDMTKADDQERMGAFLQSSVKRGATGIGAAPGYMGAHTMHVGGGAEGTWGAGGSSKTAPAWVRAAHAGGAAQRKEFAAMSAQMGGVIPEGVLGGIMPLLAHAGEMVLPRELSQGLQALIGGEGMAAFDKPIGGDTFANYNNRQVTINQTNNHTWSNPQAIMTGRMRDVHDRITGDLVRNLTSAMI